MDKDSSCFHRPRSDSGAGHQAKGTIKIIANVYIHIERNISYAHSCLLVGGPGIFAVEWCVIPLIEEG